MQRQYLWIAEFLVHVFNDHPKNHSEALEHKCGQQMHFFVLTACCCSN